MSRLTVGCPCIKRLRDFCRPKTFYYHKKRLKSVLFVYPLSITSCKSVLTLIVYVLLSCLSLMPLIRSIISFIWRPFSLSVDVKRFISSNTSSSSFIFLLLFCTSFSSLTSLVRCIASNLPSSKACKTSCLSLPIVINSCFHSSYFCGYLTSTSSTIDNFSSIVIFSLPFSAHAYLLFQGHKYICDR